MKGAQNGSTPDVSVIIPVSSRYDNPRQVYSGYRDALAGVVRVNEFVYVVDGAFPEICHDLAELQREGEPIRIIRFGRVFGEAAALSAGFRHATGDVIVTLPAFHQVDPASLPPLLDELEHADLVVARRDPRHDAGVNRLQTRVFGALVRFLTRTRFQDLGCNARAMRRHVAEEITLYGDQHRFLPVLATHRGFRVAEVGLEQSRLDFHRRLYRPGTYVRRVLDLLTVFFLTKFIKRPMRFFGLTGATMAGVGGLYVAFLVFQRLALDMPLADRPALLLSALLVVLGVQLFTLGLIAELIIYTHARDMDEYTIETVVEGGEPVETAEPTDEKGRAAASRTSGAVA